MTDVITLTEVGLTVWVTTVESTLTVTDPVIETVSIGFDSIESESPDTFSIISPESTTSNALSIVPTPGITTLDDPISEITYSVSITSAQTSISSATPTNPQVNDSGVPRSTLIGVVTSVVIFFVLLVFGFLIFWLWYTKRKARKSSVNHQQSFLAEPNIQHVIARQQLEFDQVMDEDVILSLRDMEIEDDLGCHATKTSELTTTDSRHELHQHDVGFKRDQDCYELPGSEVRSKPRLGFTEFWRRTTL